MSIIDRTFGKWLVIAGPMSGSASKRMWLCRCACGKEKQVREYYLLKAASTQCRRCAHLDNFALGRLPKADSLHAKFGISQQLANRLYNIARSAIRRCTDPACNVYCYYGERGISVYTAWLNNIPAFIAYLLTLPGHDDPSLILDRQENNGDYEPGNLRFVTQSVSHSNIRKKEKVSH